MSDNADLFVNHHGYQRPGTLKSVKRGWVHAMFHDAIGHYIPAALVADIVADLEGRGSSLLCWKRVQTLTLDLPGMVRVTRGWYTVKLGGVSAEFPLNDFGQFLLDLKALKPRVGKSGATFYKLHGFMHAIVLTDKQRTALIAVMEPVAEKVSEMAHAEFLAWKDRLQVVQATKGTVCEVKP